MTRLRRWLVPGVLALAMVMIGFGDGPTAATTPAQHAQTFIDETNGMSIRVQLDMAAADAGHWTFSIEGGVYSGDAAAALKINSLTSAVMNYDGMAIFRSTTGASASRPIKLQAQLDAAHHTAEAKLRDGQDQFHIVAKAVDVAGLDTSLAGLQDAITRDDAAKIYDLANAQIREAYSASAFAALWTTQSANFGRITALRQLSIGVPQATDQGFWYVAVKYSADMVTPAGPATGAFTAFFIHEPTGWKLWTTTRN